MGGYLIEPSMWGDEEFTSLNDGQRLLMLNLLTGGLRRRVPGIIQAGVLALADELHRPQSEVESHLEELCRRGLVEFDPKFRIVRIPADPLRPHNQCPNPNILKRWWSDWSELPKSPLKFSHLTSLTYAIDFQQRGKEGRYSMLACWQVTFGPALDSYASGLPGQSQHDAYGRLAELSDMGLIKLKLNGSVGIHDFHMVSAEEPGNGYRNRLPAPGSGSGSGSGSVFGSGSGSTVSQTVSQTVPHTQKSLDLSNDPDRKEVAYGLPYEKASICSSRARSDQSDGKEVEGEAGGGGFGDKTNGRTKRRPRRFARGRSDGGGARAVGGEEVSGRGSTVWPPEGFE